MVKVSVPLLSPLNAWNSKNVFGSTDEPSSLTTLIIRSPACNPACSAGLFSNTVAITGSLDFVNVPVCNKNIEKITHASRKFIATPASMIQIFFHGFWSVILLPSGTFTFGYASSPSVSPAIAT